MKKIGIISINLQYDIPHGVNARDYLSNIELPKEYIEDSFDFVDIRTVSERNCLHCKTRGGING